MSTARTAALLNADVVVLLGARLNWMLHFGRVPRYQSDVKVIQVDVCAEEMNNSVPSSVAIQADIGLTSEALAQALKNRNFTFNFNSEWGALLSNKKEVNKKTVTVSFVLEKTFFVSECRIKIISNFFRPCVKIHQCL